LEASLTYARRILDFGCRAVALLVLLQAFWVFAARDTLPKMRDVVIGSLLRSPFEELAAMPAQERVGDLSEIEAIKEIRANTPRGALSLTFYHRGFAYYAQRQFITDLDLRMLDFYRAGDKGSALAVLRKFGIEYVYLPPWSWPTVDHSYIKDIVNDSSLATMILDRFGYRLYHLKLAAAPEQ
jgi:hypothetical protein